MASVNKAIIVGNCGKDPESRFLPNGDAVCNISIATTETYKDKSSGEKRESTEWHRVTFFGKLAEISGQYLRKGSQVYVEGRIQTRKWTDKDGIERYSTDIIANEMRMLGKREGVGKQDSNDNADYAPAPSKDKPNPASDDFGDVDVPF